MTTPARKAELHTIQTGYPMQIVSVDIMGPLPETQDGCRYVLVAINHFTRWAAVYAIKNQEATKNWWTRCFAASLPPNNYRRQLETELLAKVCSLLKVRKSGNGMVERFNTTLLCMFSTVTHNHLGDWEHYIRKACLAYNSSARSATGSTPSSSCLVAKYKAPG